MKIIQCDTCGKTLDEHECIELGSENGKTLQYENKIQGVRKAGQTITISRYRNLHFCSKEHFIKYFFGD